MKQTWFVMFTFSSKMYYNEIKDHIKYAGMLLVISYIDINIINSIDIAGYEDRTRTRT